MTFKRMDPPRDYLSTASDASLQSFELSRLNLAANLRREIGALLDKWLEETAEAMLARWLLEHPQCRRSTQATDSLPSPDMVDDAHRFADFPDPEIRPKLVRQVRPRPRAAENHG